MENSKSTSLNYDQYRKYLWLGNIAVEFILPEEYIADRDKPKPYYVFITI